MAFYRSYLKKPIYDSTYAFTCTYEDNTSPIDTLSCRVNNATFNYPLIVGNHVKNCYYMLANCSNFGSNIYIKGNIVACQNMLQGKDFAKRVNIFYNNVNGNTVASVFNNVLGSGYTITWSSDGNCRYNALYNIYIYNNYVE